MENSWAFIHATLDQWQVSLLHFVPNVIMSVMVLVVCFYITKYIRHLGNIFTQRHWGANADIQRLSNYLITGVIWMVAIMLILDTLDLTSFVTHILAGAGVIGIIAGFALKDVASNAFAGFLLRTQKPFKRGDWVMIENYTGTVEEQGLIMTGIRTIAGQMAYIPNQLILNSSYLNYSKFGKYRIIIQVGVSYGDDLAHVEKVALRTIRALPMVMDPDKADFYFVNIGSSTYNFQLRFWVRYREWRDYLRGTNAAIQALKRAFEKEDISIAYEVMTLDFGVKGGTNLQDKSMPIQVVDRTHSLEKDLEEGDSSSVTSSAPDTVPVKDTETASAKASDADKT